MQHVNRSALPLHCCLMLFICCRVNSEAFTLKCKEHIKALLRKEKRFRAAEREMLRYRRVLAVLWKVNILN